MKKRPYYDTIFLFSLFLILLWGYLNSITNPKHQVFPENLDDNINIFILAGQSNMAGRGGVMFQVWDELVPPECSSDHRILRLNENSEFDVAKEPLHAGIDVNKTCGIGPGMAFASAILRRVPNFGTIVLVPCAAGGTSIREWSRSNSVLRSRMIARAREALRYGGKIRAILWYQGEKDTETEEAMNLYPGEYRLFIDSLYQELMHPQVPFIQVALASGQGDPKWLEGVRTTQLGMEDMITVDAIGLPLQPDGLHLTTMAQVRLGNMLADAFLNSNTSV
ncbi:UNVERIFIED_CONTAM: putative carbohydrate esterase [Sesamum radiatum]|uniref:Carbohydrate esterase n=1 Tax=Sesamum radiatum TaxID=300843 RepID=A0AAW2M4J2_SESRA